MASFNLEIADLPVNTPSHKMSAADLARDDGKKTAQVLQREFLFIGDLLHSAGVSRNDVIASLLAASIQDFIDNALNDLINAERRKNPNSAASLTVLGDFMSAQGRMMCNQGVPHALLGIAMMNAGVVLAQQELSKEKVIEAMQGTLSAVMSRR